MVQLAPRPVERRDARPFDDTRPASLQQERIELAPADAVAHVGVVVGANRAAAHERRLESCDGLHREPVSRQFRGREVETREHAGRHPASADLVSGKAGGVDHHDAHARRHQGAGGARPARAATDHDGVPGGHADFPPVSQSRVQGTRLRLAAGEQDLEQLHAARHEAGLRAGEIHPPRADELRAILLAHGGLVPFEPLAPVAQRERVVQAQVLDVEHAEVRRPQHASADFVQRRRVRVRKDVPADPAIELARLVAADEVQQPAAVGSERAVDHLAERLVVAHADVFEHPHRHERVAVPRDGTVVVFDELDGWRCPRAQRAPAQRRSARERC